MCPTASVYAGSILGSEVTKGKTVKKQAFKRLKVGDLVTPTDEYSWSTAHGQITVLTLSDIMIITEIMIERSDSMYADKRKLILLVNGNICALTSASHMRIKLVGSE